MKQGAGIIFICPLRQSILLALRNEPEVVWANFGGLVEEPETPLQCAKREGLEETGFIEGKHYKLYSNAPIDVSKYNNNFMYSCYLGTVDEPIDPTLNYEHSQSKWFKLSNLPSKLHFGLKNIFNDKKIHLNWLKKDKK